MIWSSFNDTFLCRYFCMLSFAIFKKNFDGRILFDHHFNRMLWLWLFVVVDAICIHFILFGERATCCLVFFFSLALSLFLNRLCGKRVCSSARAPLILICAMRLKDYSTKDYSFALKENEYGKKNKKKTTNSHFATTRTKLNVQTPIWALIHFRVVCREFAATIAHCIPHMAIVVPSDV